MSRIKIKGEQRKCKDCGCGMGKQGGPEPLIEGYGQAWACTNTECGNEDFISTPDPIKKDGEND